MSRHSRLASDGLLDYEIEGARGHVENILFYDRYKKGFSLTLEVWHKAKEEK